MATLQIENVPVQMVEYIRLLAREERRTLDEEIVFLLQKALADPQRREQARKTLDEIDRHRIVLPPGAPDCVELLREDRER